MNKKWTGIIVALSVMVLISNFRLYSLMNSMNMDIEDIENIVETIEDDIGEIEEEVYDSVNSLVEEKKWLYDVKTRVKGINEDLKNATVAVEWSVRELDKGASMYLLYGAEVEESREVVEWKEISVQDSSDLSYMVELDLPLTNNYQFKVLAKGDERTISQELDEMDLLDTINRRVKIEADPEEKTAADNHVVFEFEVFVENRYDSDYLYDVDSFNVELLKIKNVKVRVYSNEVLKKEIEIYRDGKVVDENAEYIEPYEGSDIKVEEIEYETSVGYDSVEDSNEMIEVIVEDYMGRIYSEKSDGM